MASTAYKFTGEEAYIYQVPIYKTRRYDFFKHENNSLKQLYPISVHGDPSTATRMFTFENGEELILRDMRRGRESNDYFIPTYEGRSLELVDSTPYDNKYEGYVTWLSSNKYSKCGKYNKNKTQ